MNLSKIPDNLKSLPYWLTWYYSPKANGKAEKCPNVAPGLWDNKPLYTFQDAINEYNRCQQNNSNKADGIGIAILTYNEIIGIDIDGVPDDDIPDGIRAILQAAKGCGYIERSVSKTGFHIIGTCSSKPLLIDLFLSWRGRYGIKSHDLKIEMYSAKRFLTVSGYTLCNTYGNIDKAIELAWEYITGQPLLTSVAKLYNATGATEKAHTAMRASGVGEHTNPQFKTQPGSNPNAVFSEEDREILKMPTKPINTVIQKMYTSNPDIKNVLEQGYDALPSDWYNNLSDKSQSGIDMRIAGTVVFWLYLYGIDAIANFMIQSAINRNDKAQDYWQRTVETAYAGAERFFGGAVDTKQLTAADRKKYYKWIQTKKGV